MDEHQPQLNDLWRAWRFFWRALPYRCRANGWTPSVIAGLVYDSLFN